MKAIDYTIGDDIVCIKSHSQGVVKEGQLKKALGLQTICNCGLRVNVGIIRTSQIGIKVKCSICGFKYFTDNFHWINASLFRSIDKISISEVYEQLDKQPFEV